MLTHKATGSIQKIVVLRRGESNLCPNTGAVGMLLVNSKPVDQGNMTDEGASLQADVNPGDQVVAILHSYPLFNTISCVRLGELNVTLEECDLVSRYDTGGGVIVDACGASCLRR